MLFTSFTCQHPEYNSRNSDLTDDWNPDPSSTDKESGIQLLFSRIHNLEFRIQDCFVNFHWFYFLKRINQLKTRAVSGPQLIDIAGI